MRVYVRYEIPNDNGETRRERNERIGEFTPGFSIPEVGAFLWNTFLKISESVSRTREGVYHLIPPSEYEAFFRLTDMLVYPSEYDILVAMDRMYCDEANKELEDKRSRQHEEQQRQVDQARQGRGGKR